MRTYLCKGKARARSLFSALLLLLCSGLPAFSQLSGEYLVFGDNANFSSVQSALDSLAEVGMNGPVDLVIASGVYDERFVVPPIPGASELNWLTIRPETPDSTLAVFMGNNSTLEHAPLVLFDNAAYVNISHLGFDLDFGLMVSFAGNSEHIELSNCNFQAIVSTSFVSEANSFFGSSIRADLLENESLSNFKINNSRFEGNSRHLFFRSADQNAVNQCEINSCEFYQFRFQCAEFEKGQGLIFANNFIDGIGNSNGTDVAGLEMRYCESPLLVDANTFRYESGFDNYNRMYFGGCIGTEESPFVIQNNFISARQKGMVITSCQHVRVQHNNFDIETGAYAVYLYGSSDNIGLFNNIVAVQYTPRFFEYVVPADAQISSDYNVFWKLDPSTGGFKWLDLYGASTYPLEAWQELSGMETHSLFLDPEYEDLNDLHVANNLIGLSGNALPLGVTHDYDGEPRSLVAPDRGADEFDLEADGLVDLALLDILSRNPETCVLTDSIYVLVANYSTDQIIESISFDVAVNGIDFGIVETTTLLMPGDSAIFNLGHQPFVSYGETEIEVQANLPIELNELFLSNNSLDYTLLTAEEMEIQVAEAQYCPEQNDSKELLIYQADFPSISWSTGSTENSIIVSEPGEYSVTVSDEQGCLHSSSIEISFE